LVALPALAAEPAGYLLARRSADGKVTYEALEGFLIADRNKVRVWSGSGETLAESQYRQAKSVPLARAGAFRKDAQGRLAQLGGEGLKPGFILPDGFKWKGSIRVADLASQVPLTAIKSRKAKQSARVSAAEFFALLPTSNAAYDAVQLVLRDSN
jgi:hypothetical protein